MKSIKNNQEISLQLRKEIGVFIRQSRVNKSLTGTELGKILFLSQQQISRYENGVTGISIETLVTIFQVLDISWSKFHQKVMFKYEPDDIKKTKSRFPFLQNGKV